MNDVLTRGREILFIILIGLFPGIVYLTAIVLQARGAAYYGGLALIMGITLYLYLKVDRYHFSSRLRHGARISITDRYGWTRITPFSTKHRRKKYHTNRRKT